jgi:hypothetical protein
MKKARNVVVGDKVYDRGKSFTVKEIHRDKDGLIRFIDEDGNLHGAYVPGVFIGVDEPAPGAMGSPLVISSRI